MIRNDAGPYSDTRSRFAMLLDQGALWIASAVLAGALQLGIARSLHLGFSVLRWGWESRDLVWRVPAGFVLIFMPIALSLGVLSLAFGARLTIRLSIVVWLTLILFSLLLLFPQIHGYASLLLALGVAIAGGRRVASSERRIVRVARVLALTGGTAVVLGAVVMPRLRAVAQARRIASLPAARDGAPNVLLIILDTVRADFMSLYGSVEETTPHLSRWAQRGVVFDQSYSTASWTTPSHASLFTGLYPSVHGASYTQPLAEAHVTLAEVLQAHGWATGGFTANYAATPSESGLAQGFIRYDDLKNTVEEVAKSTTITQSDNVLRFWGAIENGQGWRVAIGRFFSTDFTPRVTEQTHDAKPGVEVREQFVSWLNTVPAGRPFFAFLNFFDAHAPYQPPAPYYSMFPAPSGPAGRYRGGIRYLDDQLDSLFNELDRRGILEKTIVLVTSDHGEQFGEHGQDTHANSLYRQVLHVPLLVMYPRGVPAGLRVSRQVSGLDVPATLLDLAGVPRDPAIGGMSLAVAWRDTTAQLSDVVAEVEQNMRPVLRFKNSRGPMKAILNDTLHVIRDGAMVFEAYRYRTDPQEVEDLVAASRDSVPFATLLQRAVARHRLSWATAIPPRRRAAADDGRGH